MAKIHKLSAVSIAKKRKPGHYGDGGGLWLQINKTGNKSWVFRYTVGGRQREAGLGSVNTVALTAARQLAMQCRQWRLQLIDPIQALRAQRVKAVMLAGAVKSFNDCAALYIKAHRPGWKNAKHAAQWSATLTTHASPTIGKMPVSDIETAHIMRVLEPIWNTMPETAGRLRGRIERVLDWAGVQGYRKGDNPARWRGHLDQLLPTLSKRSRVQHHPALPYQEVGAFMETLKAENGLAARALELTILTACRTGEVIGARCDELDLDAGLWTIPATRMKAGREHRVPLAPAAVALLKALPRAGSDGYVFPGAKSGTALSNMAMLALLKRMDRADLTVHGFRSTFRDWAAEQTNFAREVCESALAHTIGDQTEAAYRRGDLMQKRRLLMAAWSKYCGTPQTDAKVLPLKPSHAKA